jgi:integrase
MPRRKGGLTDNQIADLKKKASRYDAWDPALPGFGVRVSPQGGKSFTILYNIFGKTKRLTIGRVGELTVEAARADARRMLALAHGVPPQDPALIGAAPAGALTFAELAALYFVEHKLREVTRVRWQQYVANDLNPVWGSRPAATITREEIKGLTKKEAVRNKWAGNKLLEVISSIYGWAVEEDHIKASPVVRIKRPFAQPDPTPRPLNVPEIRAVWHARTAAGEVYGDLIALLFLSGVRLRNVLGMRRDELDLESKLWTIPGKRMKNAHEFLVPLTADAITIIERRLAMHPGQPFVFPGTYKGHLMTPARPMVPSSVGVKEIKLQADRLMGAKIPRWRVHDLRATMARHLRASVTLLDRDGMDRGRRASEGVITKLLAHPPDGPRADRHYKGNNPEEFIDERREALNAYAEWLKETVKIKPKAVAMKRKLNTAERNLQDGDIVACEPLPRRA